MPDTSKEKPAFSFVPGRGHGPECWDSVRNLLAIEGFESIAPDFPIGDSKVSLDDHAEILAKAEAALGQRRFNRVAWSWGANVTPRGVDESVVDRLVFIAPAFQEATVVNHPARRRFSLLHGMLYEMLRKSQGEERAELAKLAFYHDVSDPTVVHDAIDNLRDHPRREDEPALDRFPDHPLGYVALLNDRVITIESQRQTAAALGIVRPSEIASGHAPMYSRPTVLVKTILRLCEISP